MKKFLLFIFLAVIGVFLIFNTANVIWSQNKTELNKKDAPVALNASYKYPVFYKGLYLNSATAKNRKTLARFISMAREANINTFVMDIQNSRYRTCIIPKEHVDLCIKNGIHPVARIVVFPDGLRKYPVSKNILHEKYKLAEDACLKGFKEIQFDYIRFNDYKILRHLTNNEKYKFIEGFLEGARNYLKKYNVKTAADVFGRIPLNRKDKIGQRIEGLDRVVDIICPMAYPSHYTWSKKYYGNPYYTVYITSKRGRERTKKAEIVTYIQAFQMKIGPSKLTYSKYIEDQIRAVHDAGVRGFIMWNARQDYGIPLKVAKHFYKSKESRISQREKQ